MASVRSKMAEPKVSKTLVRDVEVRVPKTSRDHVVKHSKFPDVKKSTKGILKSSGDLSQPSKNTLLRIERQIDNVKRSELNPLQPTNAELLEINKKVGNKLNFHYDESVYKDLIALNVDDASRSKSHSNRAKLTPSIKKDAEPDLEDFYVKKTAPDRPIMVSAPRIKFPTVSRYDRTDVFDVLKSYQD